MDIKGMMNELIRDYVRKFVHQTKKEDLPEFYFKPDQIFKPSKRCSSKAAVVEKEETTYFIKIKERNDRKTLVEAANSQALASTGAPTPRTFLAVLNIEGRKKRLGLAEEHIPWQLNINNYLQTKKHSIQNPVTKEKIVYDKPVYTEPARQIGSILKILEDNEYVHGDLRLDHLLYVPKSQKEKGRTYVIDVEGATPFGDPKEVICEREKLLDEISKGTGKNYNLVLDEMEIGFEGGLR